MPLQKLEATVLDVHKPTETVCIIKLKPPAGYELNFKAGQYMLFYLDKNGEQVSKPYSIATPPSQKDYFELCIRKVENGHVSKKMCNMKSGDKITFMGPIGRFVLQEPIKSDIIFAAGGTGISSLKPMIETLLEHNVKVPVWLFFGVRTEEDILYRNVFETLAEKHKNFKFIVCLSKPKKPESWKGETGYVQTVIPNYVKDAKDKQIYICGVPAMLEEVEELAKKMNFLKENIHIERYL